MPSVSVIIPSYNLGQYLGETLRSVQEQSYKDWECIVVENNSRDGSAGIVLALAAEDPRFRLIPLPRNEGVSVARNRGLEEAQGKYILFLDADDLIMPEYMKEAVAALEEDPSLNVVYGKAERFGSQSSWDLPAFSMETMLARNCLYISCFFRREQAAGFDPSFRVGLEDWDFWLSLLERIETPKVRFLPSLCFRYRTRRRSRNAGVTDEALRTIRRQLWEKHKGLYSKYFPDPLETVEFKRMERSFLKASRWSLVWKLRLLFRRVFR